MKDLQREIINQVASGTITAEEGAVRLEALKSSTAATAAVPPAPPGPAIKRVSLVARLGSTEIIGDPSVASVVAEGAHKAREDGDTMIIEQSLFNDEATFEFIRPGGRVRVPGVGIDRNLTIRMNPALALTVSVQAGNVHIRGLSGAVTGDVQAGNCLLEDFRGPIDLTVTAGEVSAAGRLDGGANRIRCRMGDVRVVLDKRSSVRINARTVMGDVTFAGVDDVRSNGVTIGSGAGTLDCDCTMGSVRIEVQ